MKEKIEELLKNNKEAVETINNSKSETEVLTLLKENGIEVSSIKDLKELLLAENSELSEAELANVAGGGACAFIGFGIDACACWDDGVSAREGSKMYGSDSYANSGFGASACAIFGIGFGVVKSNY